MKSAKTILAVALTVGLPTAGGILRSSAAQKSSAPKPQDNLALGENQVKELLLLMKTDRHGQVSRHDYMQFMEEEFERLDKNKTGELDVRPLTQPTITANRFVGK